MAEDRCPECGYDLRTQVAEATRCSRESLTCPECGGQFDVRRLDDRPLLVERCHVAWLVPALLCDVLRLSVLGANARQWANVRPVRSARAWPILIALLVLEVGALVSLGLTCMLSEELRGVFGWDVLCDSPLSWAAWLAVLRRAATQQARHFAVLASACGFSTVVLVLLLFMEFKHRYPAASAWAHTVRRAALPVSSAIGLFIAGTSAILALLEWQHLHSPAFVWFTLDCSLPKLIFLVVGAVLTVRLSRQGRSECEQRSARRCAAYGCAAVLGGVIWGALASMVLLGHCGDALDVLQLGAR